MTSIGKIFVIVITAGSLALLGVSTVTLTTAVDWRAAIKDQTKIQQTIKGQLDVVEASSNEAKKRYEIAVTEHKGATKAIEAKIAAAETDTKKAYDDAAARREELVKQQTAAREDLKVVEARTAEILKLREEVAAVTTQLGKFLAQQSQLGAELVGIKRMVQAAETDSSQLGQSR